MINFVNKTSFIGFHVKIHQEYNKKYLNIEVYKNISIYDLYEVHWDGADSRPLKYYFQNVQAAELLQLKDC